MNTEQNDFLRMVRILESQKTSKALIEAGEEHASFLVKGQAEMLKTDLDGNHLVGEHRLRIRP